MIYDNAEPMQRYARKDRKLMIEQVVSDAIVWHGKKSELSLLTARHIADKLQVTPSTRLYRMLWEMVDAGRLKAIPSTHWNGRRKWLFAHPSHTIEQHELVADVAQD